MLTPEHSPLFNMFLITSIWLLPFPFPHSRFSGHIRKFHLVLFFLLLPISIYFFEATIISLEVNGRASSFPHVFSCHCVIIFIYSNTHKYSFTDNILNHVTIIREPDAQCESKLCANDWKELFGDKYAITRHQINKLIRFKLRRGWKVVIAKLGTWKLLDHFNKGTLFVRACG